MIALLRVTFATAEEAERAARTIVDERLAACANIEPCRSVYRWHGRVEQADEVVVVFKTLAGLAADLAKRLHALHSYEQPVVEWWTIEAEFAVAQWVRDNCR